MSGAIHWLDAVVVLVLHVPARTISGEEHILRIMVQVAGGLVQVGLPEDWSPNFLTPVLFVKLPHPVEQQVVEDHPLG